jgi:hypothetical protein
MTTTTATAKTAIEAARAEYEKIGARYYQKQISNAYELETGQIVVFLKPTIEKEFCYSEDGTEASVNAANRGCRDVKTEEGFIAENIRKAYRRREEDLNGDWLFAYPEGWSVKNRLVHLTSRLGCLYHVDEQDVVEVSEKDREGLKAILAEEKEKFARRLKSYYKRHASCIRAWTYWANA